MTDTHDRSDPAGSLRALFDCDGLYLVVRGEGSFRDGSEARSMFAGDLLCARAGAALELVDFTDDLAICILAG